MDLRTGRIYKSREDALAAGVPESDIVEWWAEPNEAPVVRVSGRHPMVTTHAKRGVFSSIKNATVSSR